MLLFQDINLFLLQELVESLSALFVVELLLLKLSKLICKLLKFSIRSRLLILKVLLQLFYFILIFHDLVTIVILSESQSFQSCLFCLIQIIIEDNDWLILSDGVAHIAHAVLFRVRFAQLLFVFRALLAHARSTPVAIVSRGFECSELLATELAEILFHLEHFIDVEMLWERVGDEILEGCIGRLLRFHF